MGCPRFARYYSPRIFAPKRGVKVTMRVLLFISIMAFSGQVFSWECLNGYSTEDSPEEHVRIASDIIYGQVISGKYNPKTYDVEFQFSITETLKGVMTDTITIKTGTYSYFGGIEIAMNYLIFLYGKNEIDFCGVVRPTTPFATTIESLGDINADEPFLWAAIKYRGKKP